ncbi:MAG: hypothetical protein WBE97_09490 [Candidatus Acidiferrales bacterium]
MRGDDFVTDALWERDVNEAVTVDVPDFAPAEAKLHAAEAVRRHLNAFPLTYGCADPAIGSGDWNWVLLVAANYIYRLEDI